MFPAEKQSGPRTDFSSPRAGLDCVRAGPGLNCVFRPRHNLVLGLIFPVLRPEVRVFRSEVRIFRTGLF